MLLRRDVRCSVRDAGRMALDARRWVHGASCGEGRPREHGGPSLDERIVEEDVRVAWRASLDDKVVDEDVGSVFGGRVQVCVRGKPSERVVVKPPLTVGGLVPCPG